MRGHRFWDFEEDQASIQAIINRSRKEVPLEVISSFVTRTRDYPVPWNPNDPASNSRRVVRLAGRHWRIGHPSQRPTGALGTLALRSPSPINARGELASVASMFCW